LQRQRSDGHYVDADVFVLGGYTGTLVRKSSVDGGVGRLAVISIIITAPQLRNVLPHIRWELTQAFGVRDVSIRMSRSKNRSTSKPARLRVTSGTRVTVQLARDLKGPRTLPSVRLLAIGLFSLSKDDHIQERR
jgi:hypothetical protein